MNRLQGKIALITGAAQGIGEAHARMMAAEGAHVILVDRNGAALSHTARSIKDAEHYAMDVTHEEAWISLAAEVEQKHPRLDVLLNNAGLEVSRPIVEMSFEDWRRVIAVNLDAAFLACRALLPLLRKAGAHNSCGASVINMGSVAALIGFPNQVGYNASKAGIRHLGKSLAVEWGKAGYNIRVNTIHPGPTRTHMVDEYVRAEVERGRAAEEVWAAIASYSPLGRIGRVEDIANGAVFLASDESCFMTGSDLVMDGGMSVQ